MDFWLLPGLNPPASDHSSIPRFWERPIISEDVKHAPNAYSECVRKAACFQQSLSAIQGVRPGRKGGQEIAEACNRLIKNCIVCWNYLYLDRKLDEAESPESRQRLLEAIAAHSPIAWAHINMLGEYDFSDEKLRDSLGVLPPK
jgi:hypothetical protein